MSSVVPSPPSKFRLSCIYTSRRLHQMLSGASHYPGSPHPDASLWRISSSDVWEWTEPRHVSCWSRVVRVRGGGVVGGGLMMQNTCREDLRGRPSSHQQTSSGLFFKNWKAACPRVRPWWMRSPLTCDWLLQGRHPLLLSRTARVVLACQFRGLISSEPPVDLRHQRFSLIILIIKFQLCRQ